ncbi:MAG: hypothetical protein ACRD44_05230 [Bryobacteraceae bacterium]
MNSMRIGNYVLSLPERVLRSATAVAAGILREIGDVTVPAALRRTRLYQNMVDSTLRFLVEQVGQVEGAWPGAEKLAEDFALRRAAGNGVELAGILAFHASPVWVLAALADVSGAGRHLIREISGSLKQQGLLDPTKEFNTVDQMLDGLERVSGRAADAVNTPPLDVAGLRREWSEIRSDLATVTGPRLPSPAVLEAIWSNLKMEASRQGRSVFEVSSLMALSAVTEAPGHVRWFSRSAILAARRTGELIGEALLGHYARTLEEIRREGFLAYWARQFRPYLRGALAQFSPSRESSTEKLLRKRP